METFISIASLVSLVYFCYGTWRIDRTLTKVEQHLDAIRDNTANLPKDFR